MSDHGLAHEVLNDLCLRYPILNLCQDAIFRAFEVMYALAETGKKLLICGNGGSAADAEHIVGELMKSFMSPRPLTKEQQQKLQSAVPSPIAEFLMTNLGGAIPAISLVSQASLLSAIANDVDANIVFAQQVLGYGVMGDVLLGISTSGNSDNVVLAAYTAKAFGMKVIGLTGEDGGRLASIADVAIRVPQTEVYRIQELHLPVYHALCRMIEREMFH